MPQVTAPVLPADLQITALLGGRAVSLVQQLSGKELLDGSEYAKAFTVTRDEVHAYVEKFGVPDGSWSNRPGPSDGLYMVEVNEGFEVYLQERGARFDGGLGSVFTSKLAAELVLADYLLAMSGCGLFPLPVDSRVANNRSGLLSSLKAAFWRRNEA